MAYNRWWIDIEGADDEAFSAGVLPFRLYVIAADLDSELLGSLTEYWNYIKRRDRPGRRHLFNVEAYPFTVGVSAWDGTDYEKLMIVLAKDNLRFTDTNVTRLAGLYKTAADFSEAEQDDFGIAGIFPIRVDLSSKSKSLDKKGARNEATFQFISIFPAAS